MSGLEWFGGEPEEASAVKWYRRSYLERVVYGCPAAARVEHQTPAMRFGVEGHSLLQNYMGHLLANVLGYDLDFLLEQAAKSTFNPAMLSLMRRIGRHIYLPEGRVLGIELDLGAKIDDATGVQAEVDRLDQGIRPDEVELHDYKFGFGSMGQAEARTSFQARCYSWLAFKNYPDAFRVWFTYHFLRVDAPESKDGYRRVRFDFTKDDFPALDGQMVGVVQSCRAIEEANEWPAVPGYPQCVDCPAVKACPVAEPYAGEDRVALAGQAVALDTKLAAMKKALKARVEADGPIVLPGGGAWRIKTAAESRFSFDKKYKPEAEDAAADDAEDATGEP